ncbi:MAG TPA: uracil-DNA glycosylase [Saliniramus sp.]|nr:uracil-DNA glycosylase [Saliniramus sp.]
MEPALDHGRRAALIALLDFYVEAGVDCGLAEDPVDRFAEEIARREASPRGRTQRGESRGEPGAGTPRSAPAIPEQLRTREERPAPPPLLTPVVMAPEEAETAARALAARAQSLEELRTLIGEFDGCALKSSAKNLVFEGGDARSRVMLVGPAPGSDDDREGKPFAGRDGDLLERMLGAIGLGRASVYIGHVVPWRPAGNRNLTPQETAICLPFIRRQIQLADPDFVICLGEPAMRALLGVKDTILKGRGHWHDFETGSRRIRALATLHPDYVLKQPLQKRLVWRDLRALKRALEGRAS